MDWTAARTVGESVIVCIHRHSATAWPMLLLLWHSHASGHLDAASRARSVGDVGGQNGVAVYVSHHALQDPGIRKILSDERYMQYILR